MVSPWLPLRVLWPILALVLVVVPAKSYQVAGEEDGPLTLFGLQLDDGDTYSQARHQVKWEARSNAGSSSSRDGKEISQIRGSELVCWCEITLAGSHDTLPSSTSRSSSS